MHLTRKIIDKHIINNQWLSEFETLLAEIETNIETEPDISIESCKSLLESIAKNILLRLEGGYDEKKVNGENTHVLFQEAGNALTGKKPKNEQVAIEKFISVAQHLAKIRNERGDISHGKIYPKKPRSSINFAETIKSFTDGFASYLLCLFFEIDLSYKEPMQYEDNTNFNKSLDEELPIVGIKYSKALFEQDFTDYKERLEDYIELINIK